MFAQNPGLYLTKQCNEMAEQVQMNVENKSLIYNKKHNEDSALLQKAYLISRSVNETIKQINVIEKKNAYI